MPCSNCDHRMQRVNDSDNPPVFWCPRCGTIKSEGMLPEFESPWIVERSRDFHEVVMRCCQTDGDIAQKRTNLEITEMALSECLQ